MLLQSNGDPDNAELLADLPRAASPWFMLELREAEYCNFSAIRNGRPAADVFCGGWAFSIEYRLPAAGSEETGELAPTDYIASPETDRFDNQVPEFIPRNMASSPDGKHAYIVTDKNELLIFERVGNQIVDTAAPAD